MFKPNRIYALLDHERFDDEFGEGYTHVITPPNTLDGAWLTDCWVANSQGHIHPGYNACPVPIRFEDVDKSTSKAWQAPLPEPQGLPSSACFVG